MSSIVSEAMEFVGKLMTKTPWGDIANLLPDLIKDIDRVCEEFLKFLQNGGRVIISELKSLKMYIHAYRNLGIFYENAVNRILKDLVKLIKPASMTIEAEYKERGGIKTKAITKYEEGK